MFHTFGRHESYFWAMRVRDPCYKIFGASHGNGAAPEGGCRDKKGGGALKHKFLMLIVAALLVVGGALPALASHNRSPGEGPEDPCYWDWDRSLWNEQRFELWVQYCDYGHGDEVYALWTPDEYLWSRE